MVVAVVVMVMVMVHIDPAAPRRKQFLTDQQWVTYVGDPITRVPISETCELPPEYAWMAKSVPVRPTWKNFDIDGQPLFETCRR